MEGLRLQLGSAEEDVGVGVFDEAEVEEGLGALDSATLRGRPRRETTEAAEAEEESRRICLS